jgi:hypothetical protein
VRRPCRRAPAPAAAPRGPPRSATAAARSGRPPPLSAPAHVTGLSQHRAADGDRCSAARSGLPHPPASGQQLRAPAGRSHLQSPRTEYPVLRVEPRVLWRHDRWPSA